MFQTTNQKIIIHLLFLMVQWSRMLQDLDDFFGGSSHGKSPCFMGYFYGIQWMAAGKATHVEATSAMAT